LFCFVNHVTVLCICTVCASLARLLNELTYLLRSAIAVHEVRKDCTYAIVKTVKAND